VAPEDLLIQITICNRGPEAAPLHVLPTLWFRNTWSWPDGGSNTRTARSPLTRGGCDGKTPANLRVRHAGPDCQRHHRCPG
jgi:hypothetical protein